MKATWVRDNEYSALKDYAEWQDRLAGPRGFFDKIIAETHEMVQEHRKQMGLPPWDFSKPKRANRRSAMLKAWLTRREKKVLAKAAGAGR